MTEAQLGQSYYALMMKVDCTIRSMYNQHTILPYLQEYMIVFQYYERQCTKNITTSVFSLSRATLVLKRYFAYRLRLSFKLFYLGNWFYSNICYILRLR